MKPVPFMCAQPPRMNLLDIVLQNKGKRVERRGLKKQESQRLIPPNNSTLSKDRKKDADAFIVCVLSPNWRLTVGQQLYNALVLVYQRMRRGFQGIPSVVQPKLIILSSEVNQLLNSLQTITVAAPPVCKSTLLRWTTSSFRRDRQSPKSRPKRGLLTLHP